MMLDRAAKTGSTDVTVQIDSIDFGLARINKHAKSAETFDVAKYPTATFKGNFTKFKGDVSTEAEGRLTLHGMTKPTELQIDTFKCIQHPVPEHEVCDADVETTFKHDDFGVNYGKAYGFSMEIKLKVQVEDAEQDVNVAQQ